MSRAASLHAAAAGSGGQREGRCGGCEAALARGRSVASASGHTWSPPFRVPGATAIAAGRRFSGEGAGNRPRMRGAAAGRGPKITRRARLGGP